MPTFAMGYHYIQKKGYYEQFVRLYTFSRKDYMIHIQYMNSQMNVLLRKSARELSL